MKAFQYDNPKDGLQLRDMPIPEPGPSHVQLQVKAVGMCHSDCHIVKGEKDDWLTRKPTTLGHEVAGVITKVGSDVTEYCPGDRVTVSLVGYPIEERNWPECIGIGYDGGYAEYAVAPVRRLLRIPDSVSFAQAAVATDALATSYHAVVVEAGAKPGVVIGVIGLGGLGLSGLTFGILKGATVYGFDVVEAKLKDARDLGARACFLSLDEAKDVAFDVIVDFAGTGSTTQAAIQAVKGGGRVVVVGLGTEMISVPSSALVLHTKTLVGSVGASAEDLNNVFKLLQEGRLSPLLIEVPFTDIPASINSLAKGGVNGRLWADPSKVSR
ncbi:hypothetical protein BFJ63_vAg18220 [Fusarium oxysporum f. sp. narcissi]|uniref:Enoyl reductase (ER) domain-containing protein n=1 Tax=Fusarium oxysporum f. sp. narcissi TaxID=451672 RepID=A0A4Q2UXX7_FUSOX|nr:hypothetical protein BFJ63_vAg18220 [Fusarium oxysporum f. sp. narcissi]